MRKYLFFLGIICLVGCSSTEKKQEQAQLYLQMGTSHISNGNYPFALRDLLMAEELDPKSAVIQNNIGLTYFLRERYDLAEKHLLKAIELQPKYTDARNNLARVYIEQNKFVLAQQQIKIVLDDLTYAEIEKAYVNLGLLNFNQKKFPQAKTAFAKAVESQPDSCLANNYLGRVYFEMKDYKVAAQALDRAVGFCKKQLFDEPHYYGAITYYRLGDKKRAEARFEELLNFYPNGNYREKSEGMLQLIRKGL